MAPQAAGGSSASACCIPQVVQMKFVMFPALREVSLSTRDGIDRLEGPRASASSGTSLSDFRVKSTLAGKEPQSRRPNRGQEVCAQVDRRGTHRTGTTREEGQGRWLETPTCPGPVAVRPRTPGSRLDRRLGRRRVSL